MSRSFQTPTNNSYKSSFNDGKRSVDFVLTYKNDSNLKKSEIRRVFQSDLKKVGLQLEEDEPVDGLSLRFVKIHAPKDVCREYCEKLKLTMPTKKLEKSKFNFSPRNKWYDKVHRWVSRKIDYDHRLFPPMLQYQTTIYRRDEEHMFDVNADNFFTPTIRATIVQFILSNLACSCSLCINQTYCAAYSLHAYSAAYTLHEGYCDVEGTQRHALSSGWASSKNWFRRQPLDHIQEYFGADIAQYFTWLGFYTYMLLLPAILGSICFFYTWTSTKNCLSCEDIYDSFLNGSIPSQDLHYQRRYCWFWEIQDTCLGNSGQSLYLLEDCIGVLFTIFMLIWCASFLELWKQYSTEITRRWSVTAFDKRNKHPNEFKPKISFWTLGRQRMKLVYTNKIWIFAIAFGVTCMNEVFNWTIFITIQILYSFGDQKLDYEAINNIKENTKSVFVMIWNSTLIWLIRKRFRNLGLHRSQNEYDDSWQQKLTAVMNLFNYYQSAIYIVFLRAKVFLGFGILSRAQVKNMLTEFQELPCGLDGCISHLRAELRATMINKQVVNALKEYARPIMSCWCKGRDARKAKQYRDQRKNTPRYSLKSRQWISDYKLLHFDLQPTFPEYSELVVQFGFMVLFAYAYPLAPLFALLNNVLEVRLDAKKMVTFYRRPVPQPSLKQINIWHEILDTIGYLAVFTNSYIIAFNSDIVPKIIYSMKPGHSNSTISYSQFSLNYINITYSASTQQNYLTVQQLLLQRVLNFETNFETWSKLNRKNIDFWICLVARSLFMVVFQNFMTLILCLVRRYIRSRNVFVSQYNNYRVKQPTIVTETQA